MAKAMRAVMIATGIIFLLYIVFTIRDEGQNDYPQRISKLGVKVSAK